MSKYSKLVQDEDCHWYVIAVDEQEAFDKWLEASPYWEGYEGPDFNDRRIDGPHRVEFKQWRES